MTTPVFHQDPDQPWNAIPYEGEAIDPNGLPLEASAAEPAPVNQPIQLWHRVGMVVTALSLGVAAYGVGARNGHYSRDSEIQSLKAQQSTELKQTARNKYAAGEAKGSKEGYLAGTKAEFSEMKADEIMRQLQAYAEGRSTIEPRVLYAAGTIYDTTMTIIQPLSHNAIVLDPDDSLYRDPKHASLAGCTLLVAPEVGNGFSSYSLEAVTPAYHLKEDANEPGLPYREADARLSVDQATRQQDIIAINPNTHRPELDASGKPIVLGVSIP